MKVISTDLPDRLLRPLEAWRVEAMQKLPRPRGGRFRERGGADYATGQELLRSMDWDKHSGFPGDSYDHDFTRLQTPHNHRLDDAVQAEIGYRTCALKVVYPPDGYFGWHDNRNASGLNVLFCWSDDAALGFWRHVEPATGKIITIRDVPGWSMKMGMYGREKGNRLKHCAAANGSVRCTLGYIVQSGAMWDDILDEYGGA